MDNNPRIISKENFYKRNKANKVAHLWNLAFPGLSSNFGIILMLCSFFVKAVFVVGEEGSHFGHFGRLRLLSVLYLKSILSSLLPEAPKQILLDLVYF